MLKHDQTLPSFSLATEGRVLEHYGRSIQVSENN
jgi:hypothetical protein